MKIVVLTTLLCMTAATAGTCREMDKIALIVVPEVSYLEPASDAKIDLTGKSKLEIVAKPVLK